MDSATTRRRRCARSTSMIAGSGSAAAGLPPLAQLSCSVRVVALARRHRPMSRRSTTPIEIAHAGVPVECEEGARVAEGNDMHARQCEDVR